MKLISGQVGSVVIQQNHNSKLKAIHSDMGTTQDQTTAKDISIPLQPQILQVKPSKYQYLACIGNQNLSYIILFIASFLMVSSFIYSNENNISVIVQLVISYIICRLSNSKMSYDNPLEARKLIFRSLIFTLNTAVLAWAQFYLPLYVVHTIGSVGPVFVCIINYYVNNMKITRNQINGNIIAFIGIFFTINGKSIASMFWQVEFHSEFANYRTSNEFILFLVSLIVFFTTFLWSYGIATTKNCNSSIPEIIHHQSIIGMVLSSISYLFVEQPVPTEIFYKSFLYVGFIQAFAIVMFNFAIYIAQNTNLTSIMVQNVILVSYVIGIYRYHEPVDYIGLFGGVLLVVGVTIVILSRK